MRARFVPLLIPLLLSACVQIGRSSPPPTFTPAPSAPATVSRAPAVHPVVGAGCLSGLSSYRFAGTFSLQQQPNPSTPAAGAGSGLAAGSLANLVSHVTFQGEAQAPDRYEARINFGGSDVQPVEIRRIGAASFSRFGSQAWTAGDVLSQFGSVAQLDPQAFCEAFLRTLEAPAQPPAHETVDGVSSLKYEIDDAPISRGPGTNRATPAGSATAAAGAPTRVIVWTAEHGGFPVRFQLANEGEPTFTFSVDVTDVNGRDVRVDSPK